MGRPRGVPGVKMTMPILARARALRRAGLGFTAIAAVIELDYGASPAPDTFRHYLGGDGHPRGVGVAGMAREQPKRASERLAA
jgi:hypothetical protein